jgi:transposase-like protein
MTEMMSGVENPDDVMAAEAADGLDEQLVGQLVDRARAGGLQLTGEGGVLQQLTKRLLEAALDGEITDHLGYGKHDLRAVTPAIPVTAAGALRPVYTASTEAAAKERFAEFTEAWGERYPAIVRLRDRAWAEFVPFLAFDTEIRRVICSTSAIEPVNARIRRAVKARGHFPAEQAALKCIYMAVMSLDPTGAGRRR